METPFDDVRWTNLSRPNPRPVKITRFDPETGKVLDGEGEIVMPDPHAKREQKTVSCRFCGKAFKKRESGRWGSQRICPDCERERHKEQTRKQIVKQRELKAKNPPYVALDRLTGRVLARYISRAEAGEAIGVSEGVVSHQVNERKWGDGWVSIRWSNDTDRSAGWSKTGAPLILDDGDVKVAFADRRACATALGVEPCKLCADSIEFQGRKCSIIHPAGFIDDKDIRRWPPEANKSLFPPKTNP